jgi:hypothetical protein
MKIFCPVIYEMGSLGASGDLAPLAHLALPLIGLGEVVYQENKFSGEAINQKVTMDSINTGSERRAGTFEWNSVHECIWCVVYPSCTPLDEARKHYRRSIIGCI